MKKYLHEHPDADRSKHTVKKQDGGSKKQDSSSNVSDTSIKSIQTSAKKRLKDVQKSVSTAERLEKKFDSLTSYRNHGKNPEALTKTLEDLHTTVTDAKDQADEAFRQVRDTFGSDIDRKGPQNNMQKSVFEGMKKIQEVMKDERDKPIDGTSGGAGFEVMNTMKRLKEYSDFVENVHDLMMMG